MAHIVYANNAPYTSIAGGHSANHWWLLTRCMMKAGWRYMASGGASAKDTSKDPRSNKFGNVTSTGITGAAASIGAKTGYDVLVTGVTGLVSPLANNSNKGGSEGNYLVFSGCASAANNTIMQITKVVSSTSCYARPVITPNSAVATDANNGAITWTEYSAITSTYDSTLPNAYMWIVLRGPSILRMAFTAASPTGEFLRGEKVTQGSAEGELLGITWDPDTGDGWAVIMHRQAGAAGGALGWATASAITGASSGATFTPGTVVEYVVEQVFSSNNASATSRQQGALGAWTTCCALDGGTEQAMLPSEIATAAAGCTASVHPGGGGTGNSFPVIGMAFLGNPSAATSSNWQHGSSYDSNGQPPGYGHVSVANCIGRADLSPDGTFTLLVGCPTTGPYVFGGFSHQRVDDTEDGDVWPYVVRANAPNQYSVNSYTDQTARYRANDGVQAIGDLWLVWGDYSDSNTFSGGWKSWRARGTVAGGTGFPSTLDRFIGCSSAFAYSTRSGMSLSYNVTEVETIKAAAVPTILRDHPVLLSSVSTYKYRKGRPRWFAHINGISQCGDTFGNKQWLVIRDATMADANRLTPVIGPWDGTNTPVVG